MAIYNPLTGYEPNQFDNLLDNFDYSETSAMIFQDDSIDIDTEPSCSCYAELDDELVGKTISSPLFIQEREEPVNLRQTYHSHEESLLPGQSFFTRTTCQRIFEKKIDRKSRHYNKLTARIQELQNEVICMNDSRDFKDAESVRSGPGVISILS